MAKPRILFVSEASPLNTGFAVISKNIIKRIYDSGKYDVAEFGSYMASNDARATKIPWKFYGNTPDLVTFEGVTSPDPDQEKIYKAGYKENQFGKWRLEKILIDFKPDYVYTDRDCWMDKFIAESPYRRFFKWIHNACVDGAPQKPEWLDVYNKTDFLLTYSDFGKRVLEGESGGRLKVLGKCMPGADTSIFFNRDKKECRELLDLPEDAFVIGMNARNQARKLYPRLFEAHKALVNKVKKENRELKKKKTLPILLLNTAIKDVGWDIPLEIYRSGIQEYVLLTYVCDDCGACWASKVVPEPAQCRACGAAAAHTPNCSTGLDTKQLSIVYNAMDLYVQFTCCEAAGMPIAEAKACGVPALCPKWSATEEQGVQPGGILLEIDSVFVDNGTMQRRCLPSKKDYVEKVYNFAFKTSNSKKKKMSEAASKFIVGSWDRATEAITDIIDDDDLPNKHSWDDPPTIIEYEQPDIPDLPKEFQIRWLYANVLKTEPDDKGLRDWMNSNAPIEDIAKFFVKLVEKKNAYEKIRCDVVDKITSIIQRVDSSDTFRILYAMKESAGDVFVSTAVVAGLKKKYPDASIYFATQDKYKSILAGHPDVKGVVPWSNVLYNYRHTEGSHEDKGVFDICFTPAVVTQKFPHWLHNGHGWSLLNAYSALCMVEPGDLYLQREKFDGFLPPKYITLHNDSSLSLKNYSKFASVVHYLNLPVVLVGSEKGKIVKNTIDLRGQTSIGQLTDVIAGSSFHIGVDSFVSLIASTLGVPLLTLFGATFPQNCAAPNSLVLEPSDRNGCIRPCHLIKCTSHAKCIDNIRPYDDVVKLIASKYPQFINKERYSG